MPVEDSVEKPGAVPRPEPAALTSLRLDELLHEVQDRLAEIIKTRDRLQGLLDAVLAVAGGLELDSTLRRLPSPASSSRRPPSSTWAYSSRRRPPASR